MRQTKREKLEKQLEVKHSMGDFYDYLFISLLSSLVKVIKKDISLMRCDELVTLHTNIVWSQSARELHNMGLHTNPTPDGQSLLLAFFPAGNL